MDKRFRSLGNTGASPATLCFLSTHEPGESSATVDLTIKYIRPILAGMETLRAEGQVISAGKRLGVTEARMVDETGKIYAHATCTCIKVRAPGPEQE